MCSFGLGIGSTAVSGDSPILKTKYYITLEPLNLLFDVTVLGGRKEYAVIIFFVEQLR